MMLGMAASISIAVPSGRRSHTGESSVRNMAMPKLTGIAMTSAMAEVAMVPAIGTSAPKSSFTGSQLALHRKPRPNFFSDRVLPMKSETTMAPSRLKTKNAKNRVRLRNSRSISALLRIVGGLGAWTWARGRESKPAACLLSNATLIASSRVVKALREKGRHADRPLACPIDGASIDRFPRRVLDVRFPRCLDLVDHLVGQRHVVEAGGELVALGAVRPVEELEHFLGDFRLALALVHEDERGAADRPR